MADESRPTPPAPPGRSPQPTPAASGKESPPDTPQTELLRKVADLERQLKEEHEKVILQSLKAKEEEALSAKVEQQLRELQERLRREKYEQELHESRGKAENQIKELERRIAEERETWMVALKNQLKERETTEHQAEQDLTRRLHEFEQRYRDEKNEWTLQRRQKDEEAAQLRRQFQLDLEKMKEHLDEKDEQMTRAKETAAQERRTLEQHYQAESRALQTQMETQIREAGTWKAQMALLQSQLHQVEAQHQEERTRWQNQMERLEQDQAEGRKRFEAHAASREEELKREFSRRDQERIQYWEGIASPLRAEKDSLRSALTHREEEMAQLRAQMTDLKDDFEVERSQWKADLEDVKRTAREKTARNLPASSQALLESERAKWQQEHAAEVQNVHEQLAKALAAQKAMEAKLSAEAKQWEQERQSLLDSRPPVDPEAIHRERAQWEQQTKEFLHHIAEAQLKEAATREALEEKAKAWTAQEAALQSERDKLRQEKEALQEQWNVQQQELTREKQAHAQEDELQAQWKTKEEQWHSAQNSLKEAFHKVQAEIVKLQTERTQREEEWTKKQAEWDQLKTGLQADLEKARTQAPPPPPEPVPILGPVLTSLPPEAQKALTAIRQQMQEIHMVLAWLKPVKKKEGPGENPAASKSR